MLKKLKPHSEVQVTLKDSNSKYNYTYGIVESIKGDEAVVVLPSMPGQRSTRIRVDLKDLELIR